MRLSDLLPEHPHGALTFKVVRQMVRDKRRTIAKPSPELKKLHLRLKERLEETVGRVNLSPTRNLLAHQGNRYVYQFDLQDAFPSVSAVKIAARLYVLDETLGDLKTIETFVERYCMAPKEGLAQGAPCSPLLFELVAAFWLDEPIERLLSKLEARGFPPILYTRYVDDLTFSSQKEIGRYVRYKLREIVRKARFRVHPSKAFVTDRSQRPAEVTGGKLRYKKAAIRSDEFYQKLERQLDLFRKTGLTDVAARSLRGSIAWFEELEERVHGSDRNRDIRRITEKVSAAKRALAMLKPGKKSKKNPRYFFSREWIERVRKEADIVAYVRKHLRYDWAPKAKSIKCPCPFCTGRRMVAVGYRTRQTFTVSPNRRSFHCYNPLCRQHGDIIQFAMRFFGWDFVPAAVEVARWANIPLPEKYEKAHGVPLDVAPAQLQLWPD